MRASKALGIAAVVGVATAAAAGVVVTRRRRQWRDYDTDEVRARLHERFAEAGIDEADVTGDTG